MGIVGHGRKQDDGLGVGSNVGEYTGFLNRTDHHSVFNVVTPEKFENPTDLSEMDPFDRVGVVGKAGIGLLPVGHREKRKPAVAGLFREKQGELSASGDQTDPPGDVFFRAGIARCCLSFLVVHVDLPDAIG
jgi:hypothetical protein